MNRLYRGQHVRVLLAYSNDSYLTIDTIVEDVFDNIGSFRGLDGGFFFFTREGIDWIRLPADDETILAFRAVALLR